VTEKKTQEEAESEGNQCDTAEEQTQAERDPKVRATKMQSRTISCPFTQHYHNTLKIFYCFNNSTAQRLFLLLIAAGVTGFILLFQPPVEQGLQGGNNKRKRKVKAAAGKCDEEVRTQGFQCVSKAVSSVSD